MSRFIYFYISTLQCKKLNCNVSFVKFAPGERARKMGNSRHFYSKEEGKNCSYYRYLKTSAIRKDWKRPKKFLVTFVHLTSPATSKWNSGQVSLQ